MLKTVNTALQELTRQQQQFHQEILQSNKTVSPPIVENSCPPGPSHQNIPSTADKRNHPENHPGPSKRIVTHHVRFSEEVDNDEPMPTVGETHDSSKDHRVAHPSRHK